jgi:hypothetical protein
MISVSEENIFTRLGYKIKIFKNLRYSSFIEENAPSTIKPPLSPGGGIIKNLFRNSHIKHLFVFYAFANFFSLFCRDFRDHTSQGWNSISIPYETFNIVRIEGKVNPIAYVYDPEKMHIIKYLYPPLLLK